jgi:hypothetical protein
MSLARLPTPLQRPLGQSTLPMADVEEWLGVTLFKVLGEHLEALGVDELDDISLLWVEVSMPALLLA